MKYLSRATKYFLSLCVLSAVLVLALHALGMAAGTPGDLLRILIHTPKGWTFIFIMVLLSALWPRIGFTTVRVAGDFDTRHNRIAEVFHEEGYTQSAERDGAVIFRATRFGRRLSLRFDDAVTVRPHAGYIEMEGARKTIARIASRLETSMLKENE